MPRALRVTLTLLLSAFAACSSESVFIPRIEDTNFAPSLGVDLAASTRTSSGLYYRDIAVGLGAEVPAASGTSVTVAYTGSLRNGEEFDAGPLTFTTGSGGVIDGFDEGVRGMRIGGRRQLIIPPGLAYGSQPPAGIPVNSILVFVVDLTAIN